MPPYKSLNKFHYILRCKITLHDVVYPADPLDVSLCVAFLGVNPIRRRSKGITAGGTGVR
jgi:hypothetical protein